MANLHFHLRISKFNTKFAKYPEDRIEAKLRFWDFINDIKVEVLDWPADDHDLAEQIILSAIAILYPHYTAMEVSWEVLSVFISAKKPMPKNYHLIFSNAFTSYITDKLKRAK